MPLDLELIDDELQRQGVDPAKLSFLLGGQPAANGGGAPRPLGQPDASGWRRPVNVAADAAASRPRLSLTGPRPGAESVAAPEMGTPAVAPPALSFTNRQPTRPTMETQMISAPTTLSFANRPETTGVSPSATAPSRGANPADPSAKGAPPLSFVKRTQAGPAETRFEQLEAQGKPELKGWRKWLDIAGQLLVPGIEQRIPGTPGNFNLRLRQAGSEATKEQAIEKGRQESETTAAQAQFNTPEKRQAYVQAHPEQFQGVTDFEKNDFILAGKFPQREPAGPKQGDKKVDEGYNAQGQRVVTYEKPDGTRYNAVNPEIVQKPPEEAGKLAPEVEAQVGPKPTTAQYGRKTYPSVEAAQRAWGKAAENIKNREGAAGILREKQTAEEKAVEIAAKALAAGDLTKLTEITGFRNDQRLLVFARAKELNPNFNTAKVNRQIRMLELYTTGKQGDQLQSFGTFLEHAGALQDAMEALKPMLSYKILNHSINWLRKNVSDDPAYPQVLAALDPVQKEFESYLLNNRALYTEDRANVEQIINGDLPIHQMAGALEQMGHTVQARYNEAGKRFKDTMDGKSFEELGLGLTDEALEGAKKIGVKVGVGSGTTRKVTAPAGEGRILVEGKDF